MALPHPSWLRTFEVAARHNNFSSAASELGLTPAAVSQQIRLLEKHLKTTLFERRPRGVALTDMGEAYAQPVRKGLADIQAATEGLFGAVKRKQIKVRASISCGALVIAPRLHEFRSLHPTIDVNLSTFVWANSFQDGISDIDIRFGFGDWSDGRVTHLGHEVAKPVCSPDFLSSFGAHPTFDQLAAAQVAMIHGSESDWPRMMEQADLSMPFPSDVTWFDSSMLALQAISHGPGTAIVLERFAQPFIEQNRLVAPVEERLPIRPAHFIVERDGSDKPEEVRAFCNWVQTIYADPQEGG